MDVIKIAQEQDRQQEGYTAEKPHQPPVPVEGPADLSYDDQGHQGSEYNYKERIHIFGPPEEPGGELYQNDGEHHGKRCRQ